MEELSEEDCFMLPFIRIPLPPERMATLTFLCDFPDQAQLLMPQRNAIIAACMSIQPLTNSTRSWTSSLPWATTRTAANMRQLMIPGSSVWMCRWR